MVLKQNECNVAIGKALEKEHAIDKFEIYILITRILQGEIKEESLPERPSEVLSA